MSCCVPHCTRSIAEGALQVRHSLEGQPANEWICAVHWRGVGDFRRKVYNRRKRRYRALSAEEKPNYLRFVNAMWAVCKRYAIEAAVGI